MTEIEGQLCALCRLPNGHLSTALEEREMNGSLILGNGRHTVLGNGRHTTAAARLPERFRIWQRSSLRGPSS